jgi:hypothetical protein
MWKLVLSPEFHSNSIKKISKLKQSRRCPKEDIKSGSVTSVGSHWADCVTFVGLLKLFG